MSIVTTQQQNVHKSRWGFHPCSREVSAKLRVINRVYTKALHMRAAHERWENKRPENRAQRRTVRDADGQKIGREVVLDENGKPVPLPEPEKPPSFVEFTYTWPGNGKRPYRISLVGEDIRRIARQARTPQPTPEDVQPFMARGHMLYTITEEWIEMHYQWCVAWESR